MERKSNLLNIHLCTFYLPCPIGFNFNAFTETRALFFLHITANWIISMGNNSTQQKNINSFEASTIYELLSHIQKGAASWTQIAVVDGGKYKRKEGKYKTRMARNCRGKKIVCLHPKNINIFSHFTFAFFIIIFRPISENSIMKMRTLHKIAERKKKSMMELLFLHCSFVTHALFLRSNYLIRIIFHTWDGLVWFMNFLEAQQIRCYY